MRIEARERRYGLCEIEGARVCVCKRVEKRGGVKERDRERKREN